MGKTKKQVKQDKRIKRTHQIQLDISKEPEAWLHEWIPILKGQKLFSQYVRDGLTMIIQLAEWGITFTSVLILIDELRVGKTDKLIEMFPHLREVLGQGVHSPPPKPPDFDEDKMTTEIAEKVALMINTGSVQAASILNEPPRKQLGQGIQQQLSAPVYDDDDLPMMKITKDTKTDAGANFLKGVMGLQ